MTAIKILVIYTLSLCFGLEAEARILNGTKIEGRIVGGSPVDIKEVPYQASVIHWGNHICGGVIVARRFILTAAHCFVNVGHSAELQVRVGSSNAYHGGLIYDIEFYILHPDYPESFENSEDYDVALIKIAYDLNYDENIQPIGLPEEDHDTKAGEKAVVTGWGRLEYLGALPEYLQRVEIEITDNMDCYLAYFDVAEITERQLCAGTRVGGKDACSGDSGGPLTVNGVLVGIVSWGEDCGKAEFPGVYSTVAKFRDWIRMILKLES